MGEDDQMMDVNGSGCEHVSEWEAGLPSVEDLMPLSQALIPPALASAFSITVEPCKTVVDVNRACENTISSLHRQNGSFGNHLKSLPSFLMRDESLVFEGEDGENGVDHCYNGEGHDGRRVRKFSDRETEDADSGLRFDNSNDDLSARTLKRPRLVWTPQLHKRFVEVVGHLGIKNAVPKTIMQLMNVEGLTRENVASHLQKYRLYLKRMQGLSNEGPSSSDQLFASTPLPNSLAGPSFAANHREETSCHMPMPLPYIGPIVPMPAVGVANGHGPHGRRGMPINAPGAYHELESTPYNPFGHAVVPQRMASGEQQRDRSRNKFELSMQYPRITPNDK